MSVILEIPSLDTVRILPPGNRAWMFAVVSTHHDASLQLRCEASNGVGIASADVEMRTRSCEGGYSYHTANAIADIAYSALGKNPHISVGETVWRAAERKNGILSLSRPSSNELIMTIANTRSRCSVVISPEISGQDTHRIKTDASTFERFLRLGGSMQADWQESGDMLAQYSKLAFEQAILQSDLI